MNYKTPISHINHSESYLYFVDIPVKPRPQSRPRLNKGRVYSNTKNVASFKKTMKDYIAINKKPVIVPDKDTPIGLKLEIGIPVKTKKKQGNFHTGRPDADNILKAVKDVIVDCGLILDDSQICYTNVVKKYCNHPGYVRIELTTVEN